MDALAWLYAHYSEDVYRFILFLSGDQAVAEDITSEVFLRVWDAPEPTRPATARAYLIAIARNLFLNEIRRRSRRTSLDERLVDAAPGPEPAAERNAALTEAQQALQQLPEADRAALLMRALHQLSYTEIGTALHLSPVAARVKVPRARLKLAHLKGSME
ncbi:MAG: sigma-70 family RNA polymerase sigma factor [Chloroflexi bacterium]|nr:sigma-70 family RNA polymerase sigma factor [Chloroflexota bacterium]